MGPGGKKTVWVLQCFTECLKLIFLLFLTFKRTNYCVGVHFQNWSWNEIKVFGSFLLPSETKTKQKRNKNDNKENMFFVCFCFVLFCVFCFCGRWINREKGLQWWRAFSVVTQISFSLRQRWGGKGVMG